MNRAMGIVNLINETDYLDVLHRERCLAAVPFGARYRLIDFLLSSMVNSGIDNVAVFVHDKFRALMDHLGSGKEWDLDRKRSGLFLLPPHTIEQRDIAHGDLYQMYSQRDYFDRSREDVVVIGRSHVVCNIDFRPIIEAHLAGNADMTLLYTRSQNESAAKCRRIRLDSTGYVIEMQDHNGRLFSDDISMEIFVLRKAFLLELVETSLARGHDHFVRDAIMKNIGKLRIAGHEHKGYVGVINTVPSYYRNSMNLLKAHVRGELFHRPGLIYTKIKDEPPSRYTEESLVRNSLVANGCIVEGTVENSILFRGVRVGKGAYIKNSIILQNGVIKEDATVIGAILDKDVRVSMGKMLHGDESMPYLAAKRSVI